MKNKIVPISLILLLISSLQIELILADDLKLNVQEFVLKNGLKILILERHNVPTFSVYLYYRVGSVNETAGITGISHFIEHLMSKGTKQLGSTNYQAEIPLMKEKDNLMAQLAQELKKENKDEMKIQQLQEKFKKISQEHKKYIVSNEIDRIYIQNGASGMNAGTSYDWTNYYMSLSKNKLELWCAIESQIMRGPVFREYYEERKVIQEERRMNYETRPGGRLYEELISAAYTIHPYGRLVIGAMSDMQNYTRQQVQDYYKLYYAPNQGVISIVGDVDPEKTVAIIKKYFGDIPSQPRPPEVVTVEPKQTGERRVEVEFDANPELGIAFHKVAITHPDQPVFDVLAEIISGGRTSRLYKKLVEEKQIAVSVWSGDFYSKYPNLYYIFATPRAPHTVDEVEKAIYEELEKLKTEPVSDWELQRAKNRLEADFIRSLDSNNGLARNIGYYEVLYKWQFINTIPEKRNAVTVEDIMRIAKKYFNRSNRTVAYIVKVEKKKTGE